jgi:hypothetical protein
MNLKQLWSIIRGRRTNFSWMNASWGDYGGLVRFVSDYLQACKSYPEATIRVSR